MPRLTINGHAVEVGAGATLLQAARAAGANVPTLCHDDRLKPIGGCRLCVVAVDGLSRPVTACNTAAADGMVVQTHTPAIESHRRTLLSLYAADYPADAVAAAPDKELHRLFAAYGVAATGERDPARVDAAHPYIHVDMSQCVTCFRCVRICEEVQGQFVWRAVERGGRTRIVPDSGTTLDESSCVSCGACVDTCPSGALEDQLVLRRGAAAAWTKTTCPYCGVGCEMNVGTRNGEIVTVRPARESPVNKGHLCVKGRYAFRFRSSPDRVTQPMIRQDGEWRGASWEEAIGFAAAGLKRILAQYGPNAVGVLGSARATNEENYLAQKFARAVLGTNNVDCCARVCHAPSAVALKMTLGTGAATNAFDDIEMARTFLATGTNTTENHPIVGARIKQAVLRGANLILVDPRRIELAEYATIHLPIRPGTNIPLFHAMANVIVEEGLADEAFLRERVDEREAFTAFVRAWTPERAAEICGVEADAIRAAARLYATAKPSMSVHGLGMTEHTQGTEGVIALVNLALLTGNLGKPGTGVNPLRGQNNVQGSAHMGCEPDNLTGFVSLDAGRASFEGVWQAPVPTARGMNLMQMLDAATDGRLHGLWTFGYDVYLTNPDAVATKRALERLDLVVVQDLFMNETARAFGDVFLPCAASYERDGTFMNGERRVNRVRKAVDAPGEALPDWEILCRIAAAMGRGDLFAYGDAESIWNEVRRVWKAGAGISYDRLDAGGVQWPCPSEDHPGTVRLHAETFPVGKRAALRLVPYEPTAEQTDEEYPFVLNSGRTLYQFNAGTMTMRTPNVDLRPTDTLDIAPEDAGRLGLANGERARLRTRYGEVILPVRVTGSVKRGELFTTFHDPKTFVNQALGPHRDKYAMTPEYKVTAARVERA